MMTESRLMNGLPDEESTTDWTDCVRVKWLVDLQQIFSRIT